MQQINDLGIIVTNTDQCLLSYELIKDFRAQRPNNQHIIFTTNNIDDLQTRFIPVLPIMECRFFYGNAIVFDYESLKIATQCINLNKIILYITDDIWKNNHNKEFKNLYATYTSEKIIVVTQNQQQYDDYYTSWNKKPYTICKDLKYEYLSEIL